MEVDDVWKVLWGSRFALGEFGFVGRCGHLGNAVAAARMTKLNLSAAL
jgi:hypothetical protein